mmetsp:Transcript_50778/g.94944  ORF Transcript_50778/g.94944 Transcript_50778/m.94944 type:complete len:250 (-) Transcript_50778:552-1301(-)
MASASPTPNLHLPPSPCHLLYQADESGSWGTRKLTIRVSVTGAHDQHVAIPVCFMVHDVYRCLSHEASIHKLLPVGRGVPVLQEELEACILPVAPDGVARWRLRTHHYATRHPTGALHSLGELLDVDALGEVSSPIRQELATNGDVAVVHEDVDDLLALGSELLLTLRLARFGHHEVNEVLLQCGTCMLEDIGNPDDLDNGFTVGVPAVVHVDLHPQISAEHAADVAAGTNQSRHQALRHRDPVRQLLS